MSVPNDREKAIATAHAHEGWAVRECYPGATTRTIPQLLAAYREELEAKHAAEMNAEHAKLVEVADNLRATRAELAESLACLDGVVVAMEAWGSWEDGIPETGPGEHGFVGRAYDRARLLLNRPDQDGKRNAAIIASSDTERHLRIELEEARATIAALQDRKLWAESSQRVTSEVAVQRGDELAEARATIERVELWQAVYSRRDIYANHRAWVELDAVLEGPC